jgi:hypothetical protein
MPLLWPTARHKPMKLLAAVGKTVLDEEIQCTIGDRRLRPEACASELFQYGVGPKRCVGLEQDVKHRLAGRSQFEAAPGTQVSG